MSAAPLTIVAVDGHLIVNSAPGKCGGCGAMRTMFISRGGRVLCVHCDAAPAACARTGCSRPLLEGVNSDFCSARCEGEYRGEGQP